MPHYRACPLRPESGQTADRLGMSASCHKRTHALQQSRLFDHLVGVGEQRHLQGECPFDEANVALRGVIRETARPAFARDDVPGQARSGSSLLARPCEGRRRRGHTSSILNSP